jgi:hypothetical protein
MSGARHRQKGDRCERELVERHQALGVHAERYPLSGASRFRGSGHDIDLYALGREAAPLVAPQGRQRFRTALNLARRVRRVVPAAEQCRSDGRAAVAYVGGADRKGAPMIQLNPRAFLLRREIQRILCECPPAECWDRVEDIVRDAFDEIVTATAREYRRKYVE